MTHQLYIYIKCIYYILVIDHYIGLAPSVYTYAGVNWILSTDHLTCYVLAINLSMSLFS